MTQASDVLDRVLVLEMVRVTEAAAIAASHLVGRGDEKAADAAAVEAMRKGALDFLTKPIDLDQLEVVVQRSLSVGRASRWSGRRS